MGEDRGGSLQVAPPANETDAATAAMDDAPASGAADAHASRTDFDAGRRRFVWASVIAVAAAFVPYVWILWSDWGPVDPLRQSVFQDNFFDLQARAVMHGHLALTNGALGLEGFVHDGRTYTYFGLFPSILRMPILLVTSSLDGKLTDSSMILAFLLTGLFASMLLWRIRHLVRGDAAMGRSEAAASGVLLATMLAGTVMMLLASIPYVFNEDIAWSICLTVGSLFALLGVLEAPSWGRVVASGVLIMCANLDRATTGWACVVGAGLVAGWFLIGRGGPENRRWFWPVLLAGLIPLAVSSAIDEAKFGVLFGVPVTDQVWTQINAYRRHFLAANHNSEVGLGYAPTDLVTYLRPDGLSFSSVFPFVTLPTAPPTGLGGHLFDKLYRTASITASTPLLCFLSIWGLVTAFRPRPVGRVALTRPLLLAAASGGVALLLWGYIAPRYLGDFVPFLVFGSAVGLVDIFRRVEQRRRRVRLTVLSVVSVLALFSIVANLGMAVVPNEEWNVTQTLNYVTFQKDVSDVTGHPLQGRVIRVSSLPPWAPAGTLAIVGDCAGLYVSNGEKYATTPDAQYKRTTWMTVQLGEPFQHTFSMAVQVPRSAGTQYYPLVTAGGGTLVVSAAPQNANETLLDFSIQGGPHPAQGFSFDVPSKTTHTLVVTTDPVKHSYLATLDGVPHVAAKLDGADIHVVPADRWGPQDGTAVLSVTSVGTPSPALCQSLMH